jgi:hypothetical protein
MKHLSLPALLVVLLAGCAVPADRVPLQPLPETGQSCPMPSC